MTYTLPARSHSVGTLKNNLLDGCAGKLYYDGLYRTQALEMDFLSDEERDAIKMLRDTAAGAVSMIVGSDPILA